MGRLRRGLSRLRAGPADACSPTTIWDGLLQGHAHRAATAPRSCRCATTPPSCRRSPRSTAASASSWRSGRASDEIGLLDLLVKRGSRLGGNTGQMLLRFLGWDGFVTSRDVVACLRDAGLDIAEDGDVEARSRQGAGAVQCLGQGDRPALQPSVAHLRAVGRRGQERVRTCDAADIMRSGGSYGRGTGRQGGRRHRRRVGHRPGEHRSDAGRGRARGRDRPQRGGA